MRPVEKCESQTGGRLLRGSCWLRMFTQVSEKHSPTIGMIMLAMRIAGFSAIHIWTRGSNIIWGGRTRTTCGRSVGQPSRAAAMEPPTPLAKRSRRIESMPSTHGGRGEGQGRL